MQFMTFNSLLMFDIVFVFFLFLVGVTCLVYYLPPVKSAKSYTTTANGCRYHHHYIQQQHQQHQQQLQQHQQQQQQMQQIQQQTIPHSSNSQSYSATATSLLVTPSTSTSIDLHENNQNLNNFCNTTTSTADSDNCQNCLLLQTRASDYCIECACDENCVCQVLRSIDIEKYSDELNCSSTFVTTTNSKRSLSKTAFVKAKLCDLKECTGPVDDV